MTKHDNETSQNQNLVIAAATDGACSGNPGPGGWGALIRFRNGEVEEFGGFEENTTNNRMELIAAISILKRLKRLPLKDNLSIKTDSKYLINGFNEWIKNWKKKNWKTSSGKPVLNQDLWHELDNLRTVNIKLEYVKGHSGEPDNDRVDEIAVSYSKRNEFNLNLKKEQGGKEIRIFNKDQLASERSRNLISVLSIINEIANKGYSISDSELADLIDADIQDIEKKGEKWLWRDWIIKRISSNNWKIISATAQKIT